MAASRVHPDAAEMLLTISKNPHTNYHQPIALLLHTNRWQTSIYMTRRQNIAVNNWTWLLGGGGAEHRRASLWRERNNRPLISFPGLIKMELIVLLWAWSLCSYLAWWRGGRTHGQGEIQGSATSQHFNTVSWEPKRELAGKWTVLPLPKFPGTFHN